MISKKILFAVTNDLTHDRRMYRICTALAGAGAQVMLVGRKQDDSTAFKADTFTAARLTCWVNKGPLFYAEYNFRLFWFFLFQSHDVACACDLDTAPAIRLASWLKGKKTVYDAHEYFSEVPELTGRPVVKWIWERIARWTIPGFDLCYTVGEELAALMGKKYGVHFHVIRNIAPTPVSEVNALPVEAREKILLYQGALNVGRGLEACMQAMVRLTDWQWWIAGEGDITEELKQMARELKIEDRVTFLGWVKPADLPALMQKARLAVNLRESGSLNDFYSLPNKFFDAIHAALPSINMDFPEYKAVCNRYPCAMLIQHVHEDEIVRAIQYLDEHPEELQAMSAACRMAAQEFTWEHERHRLIEIYKGL